MSHKGAVYFQEVFGLGEGERPLEDFSCFYDASLVQPGHMYLTPHYLCTNTHGQKGQEKVILWTDICDIKKKNTAKIIPNAIRIETVDHKAFFFSFVNRNHVYKHLHKFWKGKDHDKECSHEHDHDHHATFSELHPEHPQFKNIAISEDEDTSIQPIKDVPIESVYTFKKDLGTGAFSVVKLAEHKKTHTLRAAKVIDKIAVGEKKEMLEREVDILKRIQHPNIIAVCEIYETDKHLYLVMELAMGGELFDAIVARGSYSEKDAADITRQIADAVKYLHTKGIVHRDLKPENLLLADKNGKAHIKIADFGLSKIMESQAVLQTACGTPGYVAPEILLGEGYNEEVDVWSIGVILYILLVGFPPFWGDTNQKLFEKIMDGNYSFPSPYWDKISPSAKDLIKHLLVVDPTKRFTPTQILEHQWIQGLTASDAHLGETLSELKRTTSQLSKEPVLVSSSVARMAANSN